MILTLFLAWYNKRCCYFDVSYHYLLLLQGLETFGIKACYQWKKQCKKLAIFYDSYTISCLVSQASLLFRCFHTCNGIKACYQWKKQCKKLDIFYDSYTISCLLSQPLLLFWCFHTITYFLSKKTWNLSNPVFFSCQLLIIILATTTKTWNYCGMWSRDVRLTGRPCAQCYILLDASQCHVLSRSGFWS